MSLATTEVVSKATTDHRKHMGMAAVNKTLFTKAANELNLFSKVTPATA